MFSLCSVHSYVGRKVAVRWRDQLNIKGLKSSLVVEKLVIEYSQRKLDELEDKNKLLNKKLAKQSGTTSIH